MGIDWPAAGTIFAIIISVGTAILAFRGQMPAAADKIAIAFGKLNEENEKEIKKLKDELAEEQALRRGQYEQYEHERTVMHAEVVTLNKKLSVQNARIEVQDERIAHLTSGVRILIRQLKEAGIEPIWILSGD